MKAFREYLQEAEEGYEIVDDIVTKLKSAGAKEVEVYSSGKNYNVAFYVGDTEYYVRPNDKGAALFYIDADEDDFDTFKVADLGQLEKKVKEMMKG